MTADDLGVSPEVNEAVVRAFKEGFLRHASLMVTGKAAEEAVRRARRECPGLGLGLHVVLCAGRSALGPGAWGDWVGPEGEFPDAPVRCGLKYFFDPAAEALIERELRAQFEGFLAFGLAPTHADSHVNVHSHPVVYPILLRLCREFGFRRLRLAGGGVPEARACLRAPGPWGAGAFLEALLLSVLKDYLLRCHGTVGPQAPARVFGVARSGLMREDYLLEVLRRLPAGVSEAYFHPSADPASGAGDRPAPSHRSISELRTLLSPKVREALEREGIELV